MIYIYIYRQYGPGSGGRAAIASTGTDTRAHDRYYLIRYIYI